MRMLSFEFASPFLDEHVTYLFEMCFVWNRVVTEYPDDRIYLIGARRIDGWFRVSRFAFSDCEKAFCFHSKIWIN